MARRQQGQKPTLKGKPMFPGRYLAADDLEGKDVALTIKRVAGESVATDDGSNEDKFVVEFDGQRKKLVLNVTNARAIVKLHGKEASQWVGKRVTLYATTCQAFGDTVDCIRIRPKAPGANAQTRDLGSDEDENGNGHDQKPPKVRLKASVRQWSGLDGEELNQACRDTMKQSGAEKNSQGDYDDEAVENAIQWVEANRERDFIEMMRPESAAQTASMDNW